MDARFPGQPAPDEPGHDPKTGSHRRFDEPWGTQHDVADQAGHAHWSDQADQLEAALVQALHDMPVPAGLAERILDRLGNAPAHPDHSGDSQAGASSQPTGEPIIENLPGRAETEPQPAAPAAGDILAMPAGRAERRAASERPPGRRIRVLAGLAATAAAAAAVLFLPGWLEAEPQVWGPEQVMQAAHDFAPKETASDWTLAGESAPPQKFALPRTVKTSGQVRWREVGGAFLGRAGAAYEITSPSGARAVLYVLKLEGPGRAPRFTGLPAAPPRPLATANRTTAAWAGGGRLYVMVVQGGPSDYRSFFRAPSLA